MITIYKYPFEITDVFEIGLPRGAKILHVELQGGKPCIWTQVNTDEPTIVHRFRMYGTGHRIMSYHSLEYIASFQQDMFVWHLFKEL